MISLKSAIISASTALVIVAAVRSASADDAAVARGREVFAHYCLPCHGSGPGDDGAPMLPGTYALSLKYRGQKPAMLEQRSDLPAAVLTAFVRSGVGSMPPFRKTEVTDDDLAAIALYLANRAGQSPARPPQ